MLPSVNQALELSVELFGLQSDETDGATFLAKFVLASEWTKFLETMSIRAQETFQNLHVCISPAKDQCHLPNMQVVAPQDKSGSLTGTPILCKFDSWNH